jgi:PAS domain S-box-containing protein
MSGRNTFEFNLDLYRLCLQDLPDVALLLFDEALVFRAAEGDALAKLNPTGGTIDGTVAAGLFMPADAPAIADRMRESLAGTAGSYEVRGDKQNYILKFIPTGQPGVGLLVINITPSERASLHLEIVEHSDDLFYSYSEATGNLVFINLAVERISGYPAEYFLGKTDRAWYALIHPDDRALLDAAEADYEHTGLIDLEYRINHADGSVRWVYDRAWRVVDADGRLLRTDGITRDITEQKQAEEALRASEQRYRFISESISDYAYLARIQPDGEAVGEWMTESFERITGYTEEELDAAGQSIFHPEDLSKVTQDLKIVSQGHAASGEYRFITKAGEVRWLHIHRRPVSQDGGVVRFYGIAQDITARKRVEEALRDSEERYRLISTSISDYAYFSQRQPDGTYAIEWMTESFERMTGYTQAELDKAGRSVFHPEDQAQAERDVRFARQGNTTDGEYRIITKSGAARWLHMHYRPVVPGDVNRFVGVAQDITKRKQAEEALRASEERYRIVSELISDYAFSQRIEPDGSFTGEWLTDSFERMTGYTIDDLREANDPGMLYHPDDRARVYADTKLVQRGEPVNAEYRIVTKSGETRWIYMRRQPVRQGDALRYYGIAQDITERKQAEEALKMSEERYRIVSELISDYAFSIRIEPDNTPVLEWITEAFERITGYSPSKDINAHGNFSLFHPGDQARAEADVEQVLAGDNVTSEYRIITKTGEMRWMRMVREPAWSEAEGRWVRYYSVAQDITDQKLAEERARQVALEQEKVRLLTEFITNFSHDFRTPLSVIHTSTHLLSRVEDVERRAYHLDKLTAQANYIEGLLESMLTMVRLDSDTLFEFAALNVNDVLRDLIHMAQDDLAQKNLTLELALDATLPRIWADAREIRRALTNVIENAVEHTPDDHALHVRTYSHDEQIVVEVNDTGAGISQDDLPHIFDRMYKPSHRTTRGAGLGLAITKKIIEAHHGQITVESELGQGSTFRVWLPRLGQLSN